jgi:hypothetical protein
MGSRPELEDDLTDGPHLSASKGRGGDTLLGFNPGRLWAASAARPNWSPLALFYFLFSFSFSFSVFPISFISFAIFIQIISKKFINYSNLPCNLLN